MGDKNKDLELMLGEPKKAIRSLVFTLGVSFLAIQLNSLIDTYWTSDLGESAMIAVSAISVVYWMIMAPGVGLGIGVTTVMSYHMGRNDHDRAANVGANSLVLGMIVAVIISICTTLLIDPYLELVDAGDAKIHSLEYIFPFVLLTPALTLGSIITSMLRAEGAKTKMLILLFLTIAINMILDPLLIYGLDFHVAGAGWATSLGALFSLLLGLYWYRSGKTVIQLKRRDFKINSGVMKEMLGIGIPRILESFVTRGSNLFQRVFISAAGGVGAILVFDLPIKFISLAVVVAESVGAAMIPVCSAARGQGDSEKMNTGMDYSVKLTFGVLLVLSVLMFIFADSLIGIFMSSHTMEVHHDDLVWVLRAFCIFLPFEGLRKVGSCMLQVLRKSKMSNNATILWAVTKLVALGLASLISFQAVVIAYVGVCIFGGLLMVGLAQYYRTRITTEPQADIE